MKKKVGTRRKGKPPRKLRAAIRYAIVAVARDGKVLSWNPGAERMFGYARAEAEGSPLKELILPPGRTDEIATATQAALINGLSIREAVRRTKDGRSIYVDITARARLDRTHGNRFVALSLKDVTQGKLRRAAKVLAARFRAVLESVPDAIVMANEIGRIVLVNSHASKLFGYRREELIGKPVEVLLAPKYRVTDTGDRTSYLTEPRPRSMAPRLELYGARKDGTEFPIEISLSPVETEEGTLVSSAIRDTSERNLQEELRRKTLEEASRLKSEFLANMSHELRTPLNGIIGFSQIMYDERVGPLSPQHKEFLGDILTSAQHLLRLINDVLDLAKIEAGKMEFHPESVELDLIVHETCDILRAVAASKRVEMELSFDSEVNDLFLDPGKLKQVLYNYLSNAIKFTPDGGRIRVRTAAAGPKAFRIEVEDTGIGVKPEDVAKLFVEFQQLDAAAATQFQGTGLGLALTKRIVEAQGGRVGASSAPGRGSTFFAILPRDLNATPAYSEIAKLAEPGGPSILVIEDDAKERAWLAATLAIAGYSVETAGSGRRALALCRERRFDAITLDLVLPDLSGQDLLAQIRRDSLNRDTPVMVVTVIASNAAAMGYRVSEFLVKPVKEADLFAALERAGVSPENSPKILCVDDDPRALKLAEVALLDKGYLPLCESDGGAALELAARERPAAIVLDLVMPGMDGFEFMERFRREPESESTPVIVWTVKDLTAADRARLQATVQGIVIKGRRGTSQLFEELRRYVPRPQATNL